METPSVTRSRTLAASRSIPNAKKKEETEMALSRTRKGALFDITNESPIVGIAAAAGGLGTPCSLVRKSIQAKQTPGSGETILRNQVKTLLHKVAEEDDNVSTISLVPRPQILFHGLSPSPLALPAPTPANTPLIPNLPNGGRDSVMEVDGDGRNCNNTLMAVDGLKQEVLDPCQNLITRALLFDSPGKAEASESSSSVVTAQGTCVWSIQVPRSSKGEEQEDDDGDGDDDEEEDSDYEDECGDEEEEGEEIEELCDGTSSSVVTAQGTCVWSIQVPRSSKGEEQEDDDGDGDDDEEEYSDYEDEYGDEEEEGEEIEELCDGLRKIRLEKKKKMTKFEGRHTRFIYNSDGEIEGEEEDDFEAAAAAAGDCSISPSILRLNGMPTPAGKHLRFPAEPEEEDII